MNANVSDPAFWSRVQFGFTVTYHYLFPQLTMGLAWFLVYWKWRALRTGEEKYIITPCGFGPLSARRAISATHIGVGELRELNHGRMPCQS